MRDALKFALMLCNRLISLLANKGNRCSSSTEKIRNTHSFFSSAYNLPFDGALNARIAWNQPLHRGWSDMFANPAFEKNKCELILIPGLTCPRI